MRIAAVSRLAEWTIDRALSAGPAIPRPLRLAHGLDSFFHAQQRGGLERLASASCRDGHRERGGIGVLRQLHHADDVILAEGQPRMLELPAQLLDNRTDRLEPVLRLADHGSPRIRRVGHLNEIGRHDESPFRQAGSARPLVTCYTDEDPTSAIRRHTAAMRLWAPPLAHPAARLSPIVSFPLVDTEVTARTDARRAGYMR